MQNIKYLYTIFEPNIVVYNLDLPSLRLIHVYQSQLVLSEQAD